MMKTTIAEFISYLKTLDVQLFVEGDPNTPLDKIRLRCNAPEGILTTALRQELADRKAEIITYLHKKEAGEKKELLSTLSHSPLPTPHYPLSFAQQRLWFLYQLAPDNPFYNVPAAIRLTGKLDRTALERSFQEIVRRHDALRTTFKIIDGQPVQIVEPHAKVELSVVNLPNVAVSDRERISQQLATAEAQRPFNLITEPLLRLTLLQFDATEAVLLLTMHHIVADGWSLGVLIRELAGCYTAFVERKTPVLPPLSIQYTDFAGWQRNWLQGKVLEEQLAYWRRQLQDLSMLDLPSDRPRPAVQSYRGATYPLQISPDLTQALEALSQQSGVSLFMTLLAAFQTLLYRYTGQEDIAIGSPIANRHRSELEALIGFFVNSLVMRSDLSGNPTFRELLERVRNVALEAYTYQDLPFEKLVEELDPDRDLSRNPLFQVAFALQNAPMQPLELPGLRLEPARYESGSTRFDLEVHLWEPAHGLRSLWQSQEGLSGFISYSTDLFDRDRIGRLSGHFQTLLAGIVANPDARLSDLPLLTTAEYQQIVVDWNRSPLAPLFKGGTAFKVPLFSSEAARQRGDLGGSMQEFCFHQILEDWVQVDPNAIAIISQQKSLTYGELNQQADLLAQTLQQMGVETDSLVGLCVDRSADMIIGILGILKAGAAYVPLDPNHPSDRLQFMLIDTQVSILLTQSWLVEKLPRSQAKIVCLDREDFPTLSTPLIKQGRGDRTVTSDNLAYVIYTSGSTGTPKGVLLSHRGLCNVVKAQQQVFHTSRNSRILQFSSLSFDASIFEIALAFGCGGTLYIPPKSARLPGMELVQFLKDNQITHALLTPAVLAVLPSVELPALQVLITGGEACSSQVVDRWAANRHFFNAYGPTETTIWSTFVELHPGGSLTIGRPILNTQVYILDANLNPVPVGIPGELYIAGAGIARGYLNRPELTAERFITIDSSVLSDELKITSNSKLSNNSKLKIQNSKLYKTGDRVRYRSDGTIEFLGRVDNQIKIRGFRVELGEIEATLQRHPAIRDAVVITSDELSDRKRLIAYFSINHQHFQQTIIQPLQTQQIEYWQTLYNQTYHSGADPSPTPPLTGEGLKDSPSSTPLFKGGRGDRSVGTDPSPTPPLTGEGLKDSPFPRREGGWGVRFPFNITGWNSSYTGEPIPLEQMQEWVSDRVEQILALKPKRVLEIGCGTGLLLFQIAPDCEKYVGTDFSTVSLQFIQDRLDTLTLPQVELLQRMATDFDGIDATSFDVVILNSIVQYFPNLDYLMEVLEGAIERVNPGGVLFVGDVRSLPLLTAFHTWVQFGQADAGMERNKLQQKVERSQFEESELAIDPVFFHALRDKFPQIRQVQIRLSRGRIHNEMTQFRYNVLLHINHYGDIGFRTSTQPTQNDWKLNPIAVEEIKKNLIETNPELFIIANVTNSRVNAAVKTARWLRNKESPKTVGRMQEILQDAAEIDIDPQDWWDLETAIPYKVEITWSNQTDTGDYDVLFIRHDIDAIVDFPEKVCQFCDRYTNNPLQSQFATQLISELRQYLKQTLPDYMIPAAFVPLEKLPINSNGKVDRRSLPSLDEDLIHSPSTTSAPSTETETTLIDIWQELLRLKSVSVRDNFFELGGHSLLATQMTSRVRDKFGLELPLKSVFEAPTIAQLAIVLDTLRDNTSTPKIPPLVRLDRSAYRRKRSTLPNNNAQISPELPSLTKNNDKSSIKSWSPLIPLSIGGNKPPFFCVHPMFGVVFPYLELANHLKSDRSFYGLQPLGLDGKTPPLNRIEDIAAYYIQAIQTLQPQGPYFLGGWSFGGLVAFEMAQQLTQAGQEIGLLAILDTLAPCKKPSFSQSLKFLLGTAVWSTLPFLLDYGTLATNRLPFWKRWLSRWQWSAIIGLIPEESRLKLLDESAISPMLKIVYANAQAAYRYVPQHYPNRITLFSATESSNLIEQDPTLGWNVLSNHIQLHQVPGNHLSLLKQPHVQFLAKQIGEYLL